MDPDEIVCRKFKKEFRNQIQMFADNVDGQLFSYGAALNVFAKRMNDKPHSKQIKATWTELMGSVLKSMLDVERHPSEETFQKFDKLLQTWRENESVISEIKDDIEALHNLAVNGAWSSHPHQCLLKEEDVDVKKLAETLEKENPLVFVTRFNVLVKKSLWKSVWNLINAALTKEKFKASIVFQETFQIQVVFHSKEDELFSYLKDFDFKVTLELIDKFERTGETKKMLELCNSVLNYMWQTDTVTTATEMTAKWCKLNLTERKSDQQFVEFLQNVILKGGEGPSSVTHCLILMQTVWEMVQGPSRIVCVEILVRALHLLNKEEDPENQNKIRILETIADLLPKSNVARLCLLSVFFLEPCVETYVSVAKSFKLNIQDKTLELRMDLQTELLLYISGQFPSDYQMEMLDWNSIRDDCLSKLSAEDALLVQKEELSNSPSDGKTSEETGDTSSSQGESTPPPPLRDSTTMESGSCSFCTDDVTCPSCQEMKPVMLEDKSPRKKKKAKKKKYGWTCPVVDCKVISGRMGYLCDHLKSKHDWNIEEIRAFTKSLGVKRTAKWTSDNDNYVLVMKDLDDSCLAESSSSDPQEETTMRIDSSSDHPSSQNDNLDKIKKQNVDELVKTNVADCPKEKSPSIHNSDEEEKKLAPKEAVEAENHLVNSGDKKKMSPTFLEKNLLAKTDSGQGDRTNLSNDVPSSSQTYSAIKEIKDSHRKSLPKNQDASTNSLSSSSLKEKKRYPGKEPVQKDLNKKKNPASPFRPPSTDEKRFKSKKTDQKEESIPSKKSVTSSPSHHPKKHKIKQDKNKTSRDKSSLVASASKKPPPPSPTKTHNSTVKQVPLHKKSERDQSLKVDQMSLLNSPTHPQPVMKHKKLTKESHSDNSVTQSKERRSSSSTSKEKSTQNIGELPRTDKCTNKELNIDRMVDSFIEKEVTTTVPPLRPLQTKSIISAEDSPRIPKNEPISSKSDLTSTAPNLHETSLLTIPPLLPQYHDIKSPDQERVSSSTQQTSTDNEHPGFICPMSGCDRVFMHKHTIQAHIKFRHKKDLNEAERLAALAKEAKTQMKEIKIEGGEGVRAHEESTIASETVMSQVCPHGWYHKVDVYIHEFEDDDLLPNPEPRRPGLRNNLVEILRSLFHKNPPPNFNYNKATTYLTSNWHSFSPTHEETSEDICDEQFDSVSLSAEDNLFLSSGEKPPSPSDTSSQLASSNLSVPVKNGKNMVKVKMNQNSPKKQSPPKHDGQSPVTVANEEEKKVNKSVQTARSSDQIKSGKYHEIAYTYHTKAKRSLIDRTKNNPSPTVMSGLGFGRTSTRTIAVQASIYVPPSSTPKSDGTPRPLSQQGKDHPLKQKFKLPSHLSPTPTSYTSVKPDKKPGTTVPLGKKSTDVKKPHKVKLISPPDQEIPGPSKQQKSGMSFEEALNDPNKLSKARQQHKTIDKELPCREEESPSVVTEAKIKHKRSVSVDSRDTRDKAKARKLSHSVERPNDTAEEKRKRTDEMHKKYKKPHKSHSDVQPALSKREEIAFHKEMQDYQDLLRHAEQISNNNNTSSENTQEITSTEITKIKPAKEKDPPKVSTLPQQSNPAVQSGDKDKSATKKLKVKMKRSIELRKLSNIGAEDEEFKETTKHSRHSSYESNSGRGNPLEELLSEAKPGKDGSDSGADNKDTASAFTCRMCGRVMANGFALTCHMRKKHKSKAKTFIPGETVETLHFGEKKKKRLSGLGGTLEREPGDFTRNNNKDGRPKNDEPVHTDLSSLDVPCAQAMNPNSHCEKLRNLYPTTEKTCDNLIKFSYCPSFRKLIDVNRTKIKQCPNYFELFPLMFGLPNGSIRCPVPKCKKSSSVRRSMIRHSSSVHCLDFSELTAAVVQLAYLNNIRQCLACHATFRSLKVLEVHFHTSHCDENGNPLDCNSGLHRLVCHICMKESFFNLLSLTIHIQRCHKINIDELKKEGLLQDMARQALALNLPLQFHSWYEFATVKKAEESCGPSGHNIGHNTTSDVINDVADSMQEAKEACGDICSELELLSADEGLTNEEDLLTSPSFISSEEDFYNSFSSSGISQDETEKKTDEDSQKEKSFYETEDSNFGIEHQKLINEDEFSDVYKISSEVDTDSTMDNYSSSHDESQASGSRNIRRLAYTQATRKIAMKTPDKYNRRRWAEFQDLAYLYNKRALKKVAMALAPPKKMEETSKDLCSANLEAVTVPWESPEENFNGTCWLCKDSFSKYLNYINHILHHLRSIDRYDNRCNFPGCLYGFKTETELDTHALLHEGGIHMCLFCMELTTTLKSSAELLDHERDFHPSVTSELARLRERFCINNFWKSEKRRKKRKHPHPKSMENLECEDDSGAYFSSDLSSAEHFLGCRHRKHCRMRTECDSAGDDFSDSCAVSVYLHNMTSQSSDHRASLHVSVCDIMSDVIDTLEEAERLKILWNEGELITECPSSEVISEAKEKEKATSNVDPKETLNMSKNVIPLLDEPKVIIKKIDEATGCSFAESGLMPNYDLVNEFPHFSVTNMTMQEHEHINEHDDLDESVGDNLSTVTVSTMETCAAEEQNVADLATVTVTTVTSCEKLESEKQQVEVEKNNVKLRAQHPRLLHSNYINDNSDTVCDVGLSLEASHLLHDDEEDNTSSDAAKQTRETSYMFIQNEECASDEKAADSCLAIETFNQVSIDICQSTFIGKNNAESSLHPCYSSALDPCCGVLGELLDRVENGTSVESDLLFFDVALLLDDIVTQVEIVEQGRKFIELDHTDFRGLAIVSPEHYRGISHFVLSAPKPKSQMLECDDEKETNLQTKTFLTIISDDSTSEENSEGALARAVTERRGQDLNTKSTLVPKNQTSTEISETKEGMNLNYTFGDADDVFCILPPIHDSKRPIVLKSADVSKYFLPMGLDATTSSGSKKQAIEWRKESIPVHSCTESCPGSIKIQSQMLNSKQEKAAMTESAPASPSTSEKPTEKFDDKYAGTLMDAVFETIRRSSKKTKTGKQKKSIRSKAPKDPFFDRRGRHSKHRDNLAKSTDIEDNWPMDEEFHLKMFPSLAGPSAEKKKRKRSKSIGSSDEPKRKHSRSVEMTKSLSPTQACSISNFSISSFARNNLGGSLVPSVQRLESVPHFRNRCISESTSSKHARLPTFTSKKVSRQFTQNAEGPNVSVCPNIVYARQPTFGGFKKNFPENNSSSNCRKEVNVQGERLPNACSGGFTTGFKKSTPVAFKPRGFGKSDNQIWSLSEHLLLTMIRCGVCLQDVPAKDLLEHLLQHVLLSSYQYRCTFPQNRCIFHSRSRAEMDKHALRHTGPRPFLCLFCCESFASMREVEGHRQTRHRLFMHRFYRELTVRQTAMLSFMSAKSKNTITQDRQNSAFLPRNTIHESVVAERHRLPTSQEAKQISEMKHTAAATSVEHHVPVTTSSDTTNIATTSKNYEAPSQMIERKSVIVLASSKSKRLMNVQETVSDNLPNTAEKSAALKGKMTREPKIMPYAKHQLNQSCNVHGEKPQTEVTKNLKMAKDVKRVVTDPEPASPGAESKQADIQNQKEISMVKKFLDEVTEQTSELTNGEKVSPRYQKDVTKLTASSVFCKPTSSPSCATQVHKLQMTRPPGMPQLADISPRPSVHQKAPPVLKQAKIKKVCDVEKASEVCPSHMPLSHNVSDTQIKTQHSTAENEADPLLAFADVCCSAERYKGNMPLSESADTKTSQGGFPVASTYVSVGEKSVKILYPMLSAFVEGRKMENPKQVQPKASVPPIISSSGSDLKKWTSFRPSRTFSVYPAVSTACIGSKLTSPLTTSTVSSQPSLATPSLTKDCPLEHSMPYALHLRLQPLETPCTSYSSLASNTSTSNSAMCSYVHTLPSSQVSSAVSKLIYTSSKSLSSTKLAHSLKNSPEKKRPDETSILPSAQPSSSSQSQVFHSHSYIPSNTYKRYMQTIPSKSEILTLPLAASHFMNSSSFAVPAHPLSPNITPSMITLPTAKISVPVKAGSSSSRMIQIGNQMVRKVQVVRPVIRSTPRSDIVEVSPTSAASQHTAPTTTSQHSVNSNAIMTMPQTPFSSTSVNQHITAQTADLDSSTVVESSARVPPQSSGHNLDSRQRSQDLITPLENSSASSSVRIPERSIEYTASVSGTTASNFVPIALPGKREPAGNPVSVSQPNIRSSSVNENEQIESFSAPQRIPSRKKDRKGAESRRSRSGDSLVSIVIEDEPIYENAESGSVSCFQCELFFATEDELKDHCVDCHASILCFHKGCRATYYTPEELHRHIIKCHKRAYDKSEYYASIQKYMSKKLENEVWNHDENEIKKKCIREPVYMDISAAANHAYAVEIYEDVKDYVSRARFKKREDEVKYEVAQCPIPSCKFMCTNREMFYLHFFKDHTIKQVVQFLRKRYKGKIRDRGRSRVGEKTTCQQSFNQGKQTVICRPCRFEGCTRVFFTMKKESDQLQKEIRRHMLEHTHNCKKILHRDALLPIFDSYVNLNPLDLRRSRESSPSSFSDSASEWSFKSSDLSSDASSCSSEKDLEKELEDLAEDVPHLLCDEEELAPSPIPAVKETTTFPMLPCTVKVSKSPVTLKDRVFVFTSTTSRTKASSITKALALEKGRTSPGKRLFTSPMFSACSSQLSTSDGQRKRRHSSYCSSMELPRAKEVRVMLKKLEYEV